jgi:ubiquinone/menaquinone biosynthesis C-methylase UbiE
MEKATSGMPRGGLLPREALIRTGPVDHADWSFRPVLGWIINQRFRLVLPMLPTQPVRRLLEAGYGSGIFLPVLRERCDELHGIDIHDRHGEVGERLREFGVDARLYSGSIEALPFPDNHFDCIVALSCLEFVEDIERGSRELHRVLQPGGSLVFVTPGRSQLADLGLALLTRTSAKEAYGNRRERLLPTLERHFEFRSERSFPTVGGALFRLYTAIDAVPRRH